MGKALAWCLNTTILFFSFFFFFFCNNVNISSLPCLLSLFCWAYSKLCELSQLWFGGDVLLQASAGNRSKGSSPCLLKQRLLPGWWTCLLRERARQFTPSWKRVKEMKVDVGRRRSRLLWCCEVAEEMEALCWAWEITLKGLVQCIQHPGTSCCACTDTLLPYPLMSFPLHLPLPSANILLPALPSGLTQGPHRGDTH